MGCLPSQAKPPLRPTLWEPSSSSHGHLLGWGGRGEATEEGEWWVVYVSRGLSGLFVLGEWRAEPNKAD